MTILSYSTVQQPFSVNKASDVKLTNLQNSEILIWNETDGKWENGVGGGGGGATITGTDDAVVFKNGTSGEAQANGITRDISLPNYAMSVDIAGNKVAVNHTSGAITDNLEIEGSTRFIGTSDLKIENDLLGIITGTSSLKLYSHNLSAVSDGLTEVNSNRKLITSSGLLSKDPVVFDAPNGSPDGAFYKIKLSRGFNQQPSGHPLWDEQLNFDPTTTQFPTGQIVEYHDTLPRDFKRIIGRTATGVAVAPATVYVISFFGSTFSFQDRCIYDPCMMRSRKTGPGWVWAGAPTQYRNRDVRAMLKVRWYFEGRWASSNSNNRVDMYVNQYRSGVLLRGFLVGISNNADSCFMSGERNFLGYANLGEDIDWSRDDFQVEIANQGNHNVSVDLAQVEMEFIIAQ